MLTTLFCGVLKLSVQGSVFLLLVFLLRQLLRHLGTPRIGNTFLWCAVLFQLLCPLRISFAMIEHDTPDLQTAITTTTATISQELLSVDAQALLYSEIDSPALYNITERSLLASVANSNYILIALATLWIIGVVLLIFRGVAQYDYLRRHVHTAYRVQEPTREYYTGSGVSTPFILGIFKPRIYLPSSLTNEEKAYIYRHEQAHLAHGDFLLKPLFYLALSVHWFNPLVWLAMRQMAIDIETSCDEVVLSCFQNEIKQCYCNSLLRFAHAPRYATMPLCFGEGDFTKRIKDILNYKKPTFWAITSGALLVGMLCVICLLNPFAGNLATQNDSANLPTNQVTPTAIPTESSAPVALGMTVEEFEQTFGDEFAIATPVPSVAPSSTPTPVASTVPTITPAETENATSMASASALAISLMWPVPNYDYISRWSVTEEHDGIDIAAAADTAVYAAADGVVVKAGWNAAGTGYGYSIVIEHAGEFDTLYAHGNSVLVSVGDTVSQGDYIMTVGSTGYSTGNHLHFEVFISGISLPFTEEENIFALAED